MDDLSSFLRQRNVPEAVIERMELEKIDASVLLYMTDEHLKTYLPSYGDRLSVIQYCRRKEKDPTRRTSKLFDRLKSKLSKRQRTVNEDKSKSHENMQPRNAMKTMRKVELGWLMFDDDREVFVQVRARRGGGTRKIDVSKEWGKKQLTETAVCLFFPDGKNAHGSITDFEVDITDYQEHSLDNGTTVGKLYDDTKLPLIRFYLTTKMKPKDDNEAKQKQHSNVATQEQQSHGNVPGGSVQNHNCTFNTSSPTAEQIVKPTDNSEVIFVGSNTELVNLNTDTYLFYSTVDLSEDLFTGEHSSADVEDNLDDSNIVTVRTDNSTGMAEHSLDDTLPLFPENISENGKEKRNVVVHRGQVLSELISHFCDETLLKAEIKIQLVLPDGKYERAFDEGGVVRDCLSEFWNDFYDQCTVGHAFKVPFLRHDFGKQQWESVGRIIQFGWEKEKYLPAKLAPVILEQAAFGSVKSDIIGNFLKYVTEAECVCLEACRVDFQSVDQEELLEILDTHSCRKMPTPNNFEGILQELAHKKLIQEPAYVIEQWAIILGHLNTQLEDISTAFDNLHPTSRKVMKSLVYPSTMTGQEKEIQRYVSSYLRESDTQCLSLFLRFCTGSDLYLGKLITINFTHIAGFQRRPVAHTCGCVLELSIYYDSYPDFRSEMNNILKSNVWVMDIV